MKLVFVGLLVLFPLDSFAWDGYDYESGNYVEIYKGNLVRSGNEIEFYDYGAGEYRAGEVQSINRFGGSVEVEILDNETGELRTFEMDD